MNRTAKIIIAILVLYIISLLSFSGCNGKPEIIEIEKIDTIQICDTAYITDTLIFQKTKLVPKEVYITKIDTFYDSNSNPIELITENKTYLDTLCNEKDTLILQSNISGINPTLDSIRADWRKQETIITNTIEITKFVKDKKKLCFGPSITTGYDFVNKRWGTMAGVSLIYRF